MVMMVVAVGLWLDHDDDRRIAALRIFAVHKMLPIVYERKEEERYNQKTYCGGENGKDCFKYDAKMHRKSRRKQLFGVGEKFSGCVFVGADLKTNGRENGKL